MPRVLVVDDDPGMRRSLAISLKRAGYEVEEAAGGTEGLVRLEREIYDLVMTHRKMAPLGDLRGRCRWTIGTAGRVGVRPEHRPRQAPRGLSDTTRRQDRL